MDRSDFLKLAGAGSIGLSIPGTLDSLINRAYASQPDLAVVKGSSASNITEAAVNPLCAYPEYSLIPLSLFFS